MDRWLLEEDLSQYLQPWWYSRLNTVERILLELAHSSSQLTSGELNEIRRRIDTQGILFKVRVIGDRVGERQKAAARELARRNL